MKLAVNKGSISKRMQVPSRQVATSITSTLTVTRHSEHHRGSYFGGCWLGALAFALCFSVISCKETYVVGDHVMVEWENNDYPAFIIAMEGPARFRVHFDGYDSIWDETVNVSRLKGRVKGPVQPPPPPAKVLRLGGAPVASASAPDAAAPSRYKQDQKVRVLWHDKVYPATIIEVLKDERYRVHYDGFGPEWDETVEVGRIKTPR